MDQINAELKELEKAENDCMNQTKARFAALRTAILARKAQIGVLNAPDPLPVTVPVALSSNDSANLRETLQRHFGFPNFRGEQLAVIQAALSGLTVPCLALLWILSCLAMPYLAMSSIV